MFAGSTAKLVVLDAGHGGSNMGAAAAVAGIFEKQVNLAYVRGIRRHLLEKGVRVLLTRNSDRYLTLRQRVAFANYVGADALVSIHMNATPTHSQRGYETYILTPKAVQVDASALRIGTGIQRPRVDWMTQRILEEVERGVVFPQAARLAGAIQAGLRQVHGVKGDRGVRQDSMHVLLGATMPAVLVEVGFLDHPIEGPSLLTKKTHSEVTNAIAQAIIEGLGS